MDISLTGTLAQVVVALLLAAALAAVVRMQKTAGPVVKTGAVAWSVVAVAWFVLEIAWRPFGESVPVLIYVVVAVALHVVALAVVKPRAPSVPVALLAVTAALLQVNISYELYPSVAALDPTAGPEEMAYSDVVAKGTERTSPDEHGRGVVTTVHLPNPASGFAARDAHVYLPPAYFAEPRPTLPVVVLVAGVPGSPAQWFDEGRAGEALDDFAAGHGGRAPVVVAVDANGESFKDTLCVDAAGEKGDGGDKVKTYLTRDVPASVAGLFDVDRDPAKWAIGGLSRGGSCALQTAMAHPEVYPTFLSMSPQKHIVDDGREETVRKFFGGDRAAYDAVDPLTVLETTVREKREAPVGLHGRFIVGRDDEEDVEAGRALSAAARSAGVPATYSELPGGHTWKVWSAGFRDSLPWLSARLGLTGED